MCLISSFSPFGEQIYHMVIKSLFDILGKYIGSECSPVTDISEPCCKKDEDPCTTHCLCEDFVANSACTNNKCVCNSGYKIMDDGFECQQSEWKTRKHMILNKNIYFNLRILLPKIYLRLVTTYNESLPKRYQSLRNVCWDIIWRYVDNKNMSIDVFLVLYTKFFAADYLTM